MKVQCFFMGGPLDGQVLKVDVTHHCVDMAEGVMPTTQHRYILQTIQKGYAQWICGVHSTLSLDALDAGDVLERIYAKIQHHLPASAATPPAVHPLELHTAGTCAPCRRSSAAHQRPLCPAGFPASGKAGPAPGASAPRIWALRVRNPSSSRQRSRYTGRSTSFSTSRVTVT